MYAIGQHRALPVAHAVAEEVALLNELSARSGAPAPEAWQEQLRLVFQLLLHASGEALLPLWQGTSCKREAAQVACPGCMWSFVRLCASAARCTPSRSSCCKDKPDTASHWACSSW